jgi:AcrR family transcriptional regulator
MRKLAGVLGVEAMSLYHHVANKEQLLDGMIDSVFGEIELPPTDVEWKTGMRQRCNSVREVLLRHPWAIGVMESRVSPGPSILRHHDAVLGCLRNGGFSVPMSAHAFALVDSYVYGFVLQEVNLPFNDANAVGELVEELLPQMSIEDYPHLIELTNEHIMKPGYRFGDEFAFGLDLILDGLGRAARTTKK